MNNEFTLNDLSWTLTGSHPDYWRLRQSMETGLPTEPQYGPYPAQVPGSVQHALLSAGVIPDWTVGDHALACEWVENRHWSFAATLPDDWLAGHRAWSLRCDGLDHAGWVRLNGREVGNFRGAYTPHVFDLEPFLRESGNTLQIIFDLPPRWQGQFGFTSRMTEPKPRFNYTWDWQPRLVQVGVWDRLRLIAKAAPQLEGLEVATDFDGTGSLRVRAILHGAEAVRLTLERDGVSRWRETLTATAIGAGVERRGLAVSPWLPNGMGEATLYTLRLELLDAAGTTVGTELRQVGFRSVAWQPCASAPPAADPWICQINGHPIFLQGVNWTPIRATFADLPDAEYEKRVMLYRDLGANVLRLWGGGFPERDIFFDLCDRLGLFVWVEFPLSSSGHENLPPDEPEAVERFAAIATHYVRRLRHHPCVLLWGGGNELQQPGNRPCDGSEPLLRRFRDIVAELDARRLFVPTSASGPREFGDRAEFGKGLHWDTHGPWRSEGSLATWWNPYWEEDDALLRSEVGAPGASPAALIRCHAGNLKPFPCGLDNPLWGQPVPWWNDWRHFIDENGREPADLEEYVAWSQRRQADCLRHAAACCKRRFPRCGGFIVWMGHDSFPMAANTSIIDFDGNPKPAWHALREVFDPEP